MRMAASKETASGSMPVGAAAPPSPTPAKGRSEVPDTLLLLTTASGPAEPCADAPLVLFTLIFPIGPTSNHTYLTKIIVAYRNSCNGSGRIGECCAALHELCVPPTKSEVIVETMPPWVFRI